MGGRSNTRKMEIQLARLCKEIGPYEDQILVVERAYGPVRDIEALLRGEVPAPLSDLALDAVAAADVAAGRLAGDAEAAAAEWRAVLLSRRDALKDLYKQHRVKLAKYYNRCVQAGGKALRSADYVVVRRVVEIQALDFLGKLTSVHIDEVVGPQARQQLLDEVARIDSKSGRNTRDPEYLSDEVSPEE